MEKRLIAKVQLHTDKFKSDIAEWCEENVRTMTNADGQDIGNEFSAFIGNYIDITFAKDDFLKRKRVKNMAPQNERCTAKRANGTQCTRRKRTDSKFCGTHIKGIPHGLITTDIVEPSTKTINVFTQDIGGIQYWIDNEHNVYKSEDIMNNDVNPRVIAQWVSDGNKYSIPKLGI